MESMKVFFLVLLAYRTSESQNLNHRSSVNGTLSDKTSSRYHMELTDRNYFIENFGLEDLNHDQISSSLGGLLARLQESGYDSRFRPHLCGRPVYVSCSIYVGSISSISESSMDFSLDFYFRQSWDDYRLKWCSNDSEAVNIAGDSMADFYYIWMPDSTFPNVKEASLHTVTRHNGFVRVLPHGHVKMSTRVKLTASCPMDLREFPMDTQTCPLYIQSFALPISDIVYGWSRDQNSSLNVKQAVSFDMDAIKLTSFVLIGYLVEEDFIVTHDGYNHSRLALRIFFKRNLGYYLIQVYLPAALMVTCSFVSFWLPRQSSPARVTLGVTTILVCVTLSGQQYISLPKISYLKAIDIYLLICFATVFFALTEFAFVSVLMRRVTKQKSRETKSTTTGIVEEILFERSFLQRFLLTGPPLQPPANNNSDDDDENDDSDDDEATTLNCHVSSLMPSRVENISRIAFPLTFFVFNMLYWIYFYIKHPAHDLIAGFVKLDV